LEDGTWKGVWHDADSDPSTLGNQILDTIRSRRGRVRILMRELILDAPGGWLSAFGDKVRADPEKCRWPVYFTPDNYKRLLDFNYMYLFDAENRRLDIIIANEDTIDALEPWMTVEWDKRGNPTPERLENP
jgi:hypothetical protein